MKLTSLFISILIGLFLANAAVLMAGAQYVQPAAAGDQIMVNQPVGAAGPGDIVAPASMAPNAGIVNPNFAQQPYSYAAPYANTPYDASALGGAYGAPLAAGYAAPLAGGCAAPLAGGCGVPLATGCVAPVAACGPYTSGFTYSAQQGSSFGPFSPPETYGAEQFYQYPGLTPYGAYPGAGYAAAGGVGYDPMSGYYGPYGAATPLV